MVALVRSGTDRGRTVAGHDRQAHDGERFFRICAYQSGLAERKNMNDLDHTLSIATQAKVLNTVSRGAVYYQPRVES
jgi:hypothetical protein